MTTIAHPVDSAHFDKARRERAERGARGANKRWSTRDPWSAYVIPAERSDRWSIRWRYRGKKYHQGSVDTREEADAILAVVIKALRAGIAPPKLPTGRAAKETEPDATAVELAARRAAMKLLMTNPERCDVCGMIKPCDPCIGEQRAELASSRRGE